MTSLTREALLDKGKPRYEEVEFDGDTVGVRTVSELKQSQRDAKGFNKETGERLDDHWDRMRAYAFIDQLMVDENTPMFKESDLDAILAMSTTVTRPLYQVIKKFNGEDEDEKKTESGESADSESD